MEELEIENLTDWVNEPTLISLKEDFTSTKSSHDSYLTKIKKWEDIRKTEGQYKTPKSKSRSSIDPKLAKKQLEWRYPALTEPFLNSQKLFTVRPRTFEDKKSADENEVLLNYQFDNVLNKVSFIDEYVRRNVNQGIGITKTVWCRETKTVEKVVPVYAYTALENEQELESFNQLVELKNTNYNEFLDLPDEAQESVLYFEETGLPNVAEKIGEEKVKEKEITKNEPMIEMLDPNNVYIDPSCGSNPKQAKFIIISFETSYAELKAKNIYKNLEQVHINDADPVADSDHRSKEGEYNSSFNFTDKPRKRVVAYEYWGYYDIHDTGELVSICATWVGSTLIKLEENPFPNGELPFVISTYNPDFDTVYGDSDIELLEDSQLTVGAVTRGVIDLLGKSANSQTGFAKGFLSADNRRRYNAGQDYEFNMNNVPQQAIYQHTYPEIKPTTMHFMQQLQNEAESLTGVKTYNEGLNGNQLGSLAAGVKGVLNATSNRESSILRRLIVGITEIGKNLLRLNHQFLSDEEIIRVTNKAFKRIRRKDLKGHFDLKISINIPEVDEKMVQNLAFILQTVGSTMGIEFTKIILAEIARIYNMPELQEKISSYNPEPTPEEKQMQQLELQKAELELRKIESEIALNEAKAREEDSKAQKNLVDTQKDATGIKHQEAMEQTKAQANANKDLKIVEGIMDNETKDANIETAAGYSALTNT